MNRGVDAGFREVALTLPPQIVSDYLALSSWSLERRDSVREIWRLTDLSGESIGRLMLPLERDYSDYIERYADALVTLANVYKWDRYQLQEQIVSIRSDLLFVRLDQDMSDGMIPFWQAEITLSAIRSMVRSAAMSAAGVKIARKRRAPAIVESFLNDDFRLGHTKHGSYIFTVAARLGDIPTSMEAGVSPPDNVISLSTYGFSRRVMETLAANVELARTRGEEGWFLSADRTPSGNGIDYWFLEALDEITSVKGLQSLELSFKWALAASRPKFGTEILRIDRRAFPILAEARALIAPEVAVQNSSGKDAVAAVPRPETLVGPVIALIRQSVLDNEAESADAVILSNVNGRGGLKQVHIRLSGRNHELAILAYRSQIPLTVTGNLIYVSKEWRLVGDVEIDASSLEFQEGKDLGE